MNRLVWTSLSAFLAITMLIASVHAWTVSVNATPSSILPAGSTTITVTSDLTASGSITVIGPGGSPVSAVPITITGGTTVSKIYPTDFAGGSTTKQGTYEVDVLLANQTFKAFFEISFFVIPESPLGTLLGLLMPLAAVAVYAKSKGISFRL